MPTLEVCIDNAAGLQACIEEAAHRIELCSALELGGLTPSAGFIRLAAMSSIPVYALIRPRSGDFCFNSREIDIMREDINSAKNAGLAGVVIGISDQHGELNYKAMRQLCVAAGAMNKTLHRVIDTLNNPLDAMEQAIDLGMNHILSSGGAPSVKDGVAILSKMHQQADGRIDIIAGAGLTPALVPMIYEETGITSFHSSCRRLVGSDVRLNKFGFAGIQRFTSVEMIREYKDLLFELDG